MNVRFLADADLNKAIVSGVLRREPSLDFLTAQAAGLRRMTDPEVLALAAEQQRVLVSHDVGAMPAHFSAFQNKQKTLRRRIPCSAEPRRADSNRRTPPHLARIGSFGVGKPTGVAAALRNRAGRAHLSNEPGALLWRGATLRPTAGNSSNP